MLQTVEHRDLLWAVMRQAQVYAGSYDPETHAAVIHADFGTLEKYIAADLTSGDPTRTRRGFLSVMWWGMHGGDQRFMPARFTSLEAARSPHKYELAASLLPALATVFTGAAHLYILKGLGLPGYSGVSFVSKLRMFTLPYRYVVLDTKLVRMQNTTGRARNVLDAVHVTRTEQRKPEGSVTRQVSIAVNDHNELAYEAWSRLCRRIAEDDFQGEVLHGRFVNAADVERGFFALVGAGRTDEGREILNSVHNR